MRIIAITTPKVDDMDALLIKSLLEGGIDMVHLRKPESDIHECRQLLNVLTKEERGKIIIHDFPELYDEFSLKGIHINRNVSRLPDNYNGYKTRSCHSLEEVKRYKDEYDYLFLNPIFDSISKIGYRAGFHKEELQEASKKGIIDERVVALGGVTLESIAYLKGLKFGGVAMIGGIYNIDGLNRLKDLNKYRS